MKGVIAGTTIKDKITKEVLYKKGDLRTDKVEAERRSFDKTIAAAKQFDTYQKLKKSANRYDYDDMILNVLQAFQTNDLLLGKYQEQFHFFLVDEYQDTNGAQNEILNLLFSYWDKPNIFVVGDDDQSIFRFQGASLEISLDFTKNHSSLAKKGTRKQYCCLKK